MQIWGNKCQESLLNSKDLKLSIFSPNHFHLHFEIWVMNLINSYRCAVEPCRLIGNGNVWKWE